MSNNIHPTIAASIAHWIPPPTICRRCDDVIDVAAHTLAACESAQQEQALAADIEANYEKAHRANERAFIRAMFDQINDKTGAFQ